MADPAGVAREQLATVDDSIRPGARIAIGVGSRGIDNLVPIVRATADHIRARGAEPLIVPAMGSHGGASAEGQAEVLASYGVTEKQCTHRCTVRWRLSSGCPHLTVARMGRPTGVTEWIEVLDAYAGPVWPVDELALGGVVPRRGSAQAAALRGCREVSHVAVTIDGRIRPSGLAVSGDAATWLSPLHWCHDHNNF